MSTTVELCRVYEARVGNQPGYRTRIMVCGQDEKRFREDAARGRTLYQLGRMVLETPDRDLARSKARIHYA